jgi:hypothetical protein
MVESNRTCTNKEDFVYGITGILNISIPKSLTLDQASKELIKALQKQGIFSMNNYKIFPYSLKSVFGNVGFVDGMRVLGRVDDIYSLELDPDVCIVP